MFLTKNGKSVKYRKQSANNVTELPKATQSVANSLRITKQKPVFPLIITKIPIRNNLIISFFGLNYFFLYLCFAKNLSISIDPFYWVIFTTEKRPKRIVND